MAIKGISLVENENFYSSFDEAPEIEKTKWIIGAVDVGVRSMVQDNAIAWVQTDGGTMQMVNRSSFRDFEMVRFGLKSFELFSDEKGPILPAFVDRAVNGKVYKIMADEVLNKIPGPVLAELSTRIIEINTASDHLRKK